MFEIKVLRNAYQEAYEETPRGPLPMVFDDHLYRGPFQTLDNEGAAHGPIQCLYNGTIPVEYKVKGKKVTGFGIRFESLDNEFGSVVLGTVDADTQMIILDGPRIACAQDPAIMVIGGRAILTCNVYTVEDGVINSVRQYFYYLDDLSKPFAIGPLGQKCCRLIDLPKGKIGVFARKQEWPEMRGQLAYIEIDTLGELEGAIPQAKLIGPITSNDCWLGANQLLSLDKAGRYIGVIGHIADFDPEQLALGKEKKRYFATAAVFDRQTQTIVDMVIIADAANLEFNKHSKLECLGFVIYSSGVVPQAGFYRYRFYGGYGDIRSFWWDMNIPLFDYYIQ